MASAAPAPPAGSDSAGRLAESMYEFLKPMAAQCSSEVSAVVASQKSLSDQIGRLYDELQKLGAMTAKSSGLGVYTRKLSAARTRVISVGHSLTTIEARIAAMTQELRSVHPAAALLVTSGQAAPAAPAAATTATSAPVVVVTSTEEKTVEPPPAPSPQQ